MVFNIFLQFKNLKSPIFTKQNCQVFHIPNFYKSIIILCSYFSCLFIEILSFSHSESNIHTLILNNFSIWHDQSIDRWMIIISTDSYFEKVIFPATRYKKIAFFYFQRIIFIPSCKGKMIVLIFCRNSKFS